MHAYYLILFLAVLSYYSCKQKQFIPEDYNGDWMIIGHGGGFSGQVIEYQLMENGRVFRKNSLNKVTEEVKSLSKSTYQQVISNFSKLGLDQIEMNQPDNMYYYIIWSFDGKGGKIVWNNNDTSENQEKLQLFFNTVLHRLKN